MKLYIRPITASQDVDKTISRCGEYELVKTAKGELYVYYPGGFVKFTGSGHPSIPEEVQEKFAPYTTLGKQLLRNGENPYDELYD